MYYGTILKCYLLYVLRNLGIRFWLADMLINREHNSHHTDSLECTGDNNINLNHLYLLS